MNDESPISYMLHSAISFSDDYLTVYKDNKKLLRTNQSGSVLFLFISNKSFMLDKILTYLKSNDYVFPKNVDESMYLAQIIQYLYSIGVIIVNE